ncbi:MAG: IS701 family transposase [Actinomycetes bacterium]
MSRLVSFIKTFSHFFRTRSDHNIAEIRAYLFGLMQGKRGAKNIERMNESVPDFIYQNVQQAISDSPWDARPVMDEVARRADQLLGSSPRPRLDIDDSGFQKKGNKSVGVARQYLGRLGKVENGQVAVCTSLASGQTSTLIDIRLYLPEVWCADPTRCAQAHIPEGERHFRSKTQLALESIRHQRELGIRFEIIGMDSGYGSHHGFLHELDRDGEDFVAEVHCDQHIWTQNPWPHYQSARPGKPLQHPKSSRPSQRVDDWASAQPDTAWKRLKVRDSDQGWVEVSYLSERIHVIEGDIVKVWWLLVWENPDERCNNGTKSKTPRRHYALSNASADTDERLLVGDGVGRNVIERNFRDGKSEVGMADYQTRGWVAWHHHMALVMMALLFLMQERMHSPQPASEEGPIGITSGDITFILERYLPNRAYGQANEEEVRKMLEARIQQRLKDQVRRRRLTRKKRPQLMPDELPPQITQ